MAPYLFSDTPFPENHIKVRFAGSGACGDAFYALPKDALLRKETKKDDLMYLSQRLVVVKVIRPTLLDFQAEAESLSLIRSSYPDLDRVAQIVDSGNLGEKHTWFSTEAVPGISLDKFYAAMPRYLLFHVFTELVGVLGYLHNMSPCGIAHNDLHLGNIMLSKKQDRPGLPNVVLVDFGSASSWRLDCFEELDPQFTVVMKERDVTDLCDSIHVLIEESTYARDRCLEDVLDPIVELDDPFTEFLLETADLSLARAPSLDIIWSQWGKRAMSERDAAPKELCPDIAKGIWDDEKMAADIREAVSEYWGGQSGDQ